jgi:DNA repair exonuclease SbcCD ATPase subunit
LLYDGRRGTKEKGRRVREVTPIVDDQEMLRAYAETIKLKDAEIERLKDKIRGLEKLNQMTDEEVVMELKAETGQLKSLLTRAADALESTKWDWHQARLLIDELRKAAK